MNKKYQLTKTARVFMVVFMVVGLILSGFLISHQALAGTATLDWNANTESDLAGYKVYYGTSTRSGTDPKTCGMCGYSTSTNVGNVLTYTFNNLTDGLTYYFSVSAYDASNNESSFSSQVSKIISSTTDTTAPSIPTNLSATAISSSQINLSWTASTDNVAVTGYRIYRSGNQISTSTTNSYSNTGLTASTTYTYTVSAYDATGNVSSQSSSTSATTQSSSSCLTSASIWQNSSISSQTGSFALEFDATPGGSNVDVVMGLSNGSASDFSNIAVTPRFNSSGFIDARSGGVYIASSLISYAANTSYHFRIPVDIISHTYSVYVKSGNSNEQTVGVNLSFRTEQNTVSTLNNFTVYAEIGNASVCNIFITASTTDTTAPSIPTNLSATAISSNQINLSWTASTDNVAVTGYRIYRSGNQISTSTTNSYSNTGLTASTTYTYTVSAYDAAGNTSGQSSSATATTQVDITPPSAIANLASNITQTSVDLSWTATGNDGNTGTASSYDIRYSTSTITSSNWSSAIQVSGEPTPLIAGTTQTFTVVGLSSNTQYYFAITATDDAGNISNLSNVVSATTQSLTLSVSLSASPNSGIVPLNNISLSASVSGSATGNINYTFYCNRSDSGTNITTPYSAKYDNQSATSYVASNLCSYQNSGSYSAKVIIERGTIVSENRAIIVVSASTPTPTPTPTPTSGGGGGGGGGGGSYSDTTAPSVPSSFSASPLNKQISLSWKNPTDSDFVRVLITRKEGSSPTSRTDGIYVYEGNLEIFIDKKVENNKTYYYAIYAYDKKPNFSGSAIAFATPLASIVSSMSTSNQSTLNQQSSQSTVITGPFALGQRSEQVKVLQQALSQDKEIYPEGIITGYYGNMTKNAVTKFQQKYGLTPDGIAGPTTRAKLNEIYKGQISSQSVQIQQSSVSTNQALIQTLQQQIQILQQKLIELLAKLAEMLKNEAKQ